LFNDGMRIAQEEASCSVYCSARKPLYAGPR